MNTVLRDTTTVEDSRLGRLISFDDRSRDYPIRTLLGGVAATPETVLWTLSDAEVGTVLDQGRNGSCVGFGVSNELRFAPGTVSGVNNRYALEEIYWNAQRNDQWKGGAYPGARPRYEGTAVLAGVKEAKKRGFYGEYRWAFGEPDLALGLSVGPAILGVPWLSGMGDTNAKGFITATGSNQGGHCILCIGVDVAGGYYTLYNSWGPRWGTNGTCKIKRADLAKLLADKGEACIISTRLPKTSV